MIIRKTDKEMERVLYRRKKCVIAMESCVPKDIIKNKASLIK